MKTIAALGPTHTFSEIAAQLYTDRHAPDAEIQLFPTIKQVFSMVGKKCSLGVLPIENMLDGYIPQILDLLLRSKLTIIDEILLPIHFSFAANSPTLEEVKRIYVQFVSQGQCSDFIEALAPDIEIVTTPSNGASVEMLLKGNPEEGAIVPSHAMEARGFSMVIDNVSDYVDNKTRFIVIAEQEEEYSPNLTYKTSIAIIEGLDRPGMLTDILSAFSKRSINLLSIMSRPTKESMGKYHFFIDIDGYVRNEAIQEALMEVRQCGLVKIIGSFPKAEQLSSPVVSQEASHGYPESPWAGDQATPRVTITHGEDPYANTRNALSAIDPTPIAGKRVLLKPNAGRIAQLGSGVVTNPAVVAAAIDFFREAGAATCAVGESPITGVDVLEAFEASGIAAVCRERGCTLIDLDKRSPVEVFLPNTTALDKISVCADVFDFDIIVSIPVMKMHMHTGVTLSVKNMKGCLWSRSKVQLHMLPPVPFYDDKSLNVAIADMASVLYPHLSIIDGTVGMEGLGPSAGKAKPLGIVLASTCALAADTIACELMGVQAASVPHLRILGERGLGTIDPGKIDVSPHTWRSLINPFAPAPENFAIEYPNVTILDENSCSACQSTLLLFLKRFGGELSDYFPPGSPVTIAIGKGHREVPLDSLCIGNCTRNFRDQTTYVSGCPPVASSIIRALKKSREGVV